MLLGITTYFDDPQGLAAVRLDEWEDPSDKADDDEVTVYGVNSGKNEIIYNTSMYGLDIYRPSGPLAFKNPKGITALEDGTVYICDYGNNRVCRLRNKARELSHSKIISEKLDGPFDADHDYYGNLYVTEKNGGRIARFDSGGNLEGYTGEGFLDGPQGIAISDSRKGKEKYLYYEQADWVFTVDKKGKRITKFTLSGERLKSIGTDSNPLKGEYCYLESDYYSSLWAVDKIRGAIDKYDKDLNFVCSFGKNGDGEKEFDEPRGITAYKRFGQFFIAEKKGAQYYWVGTRLNKFKVSRLGKKVFQVSFYLTEPANLRIYIEDDSRERKRKRLILKKRVFMRDRSIPFKIPDNVKINPSTALMFVFEPTYSSRTYFEITRKTKIGGIN